MFILLVIKEVHKKPNSWEPDVRVILIQKENYRGDILGSFEKDFGKLLADRMASPGGRFFLLKDFRRSDVA